MGIERRRFPRINIKFSVECRGKNIWQKAESFNLSRGGMFIATEKVEPPGTEINIIFEVGKERKLIQVNAVVRWSRIRPEYKEKGEGLPAGMGVEFLRIFPSDAKDFLEELIKTYIKKM
ncbi:MAG: hypothetical protein DRP76_01375 [Candidatus Omnitrophota bacterium]|nr:MAG: hypothetical protein DRP76_01375 [Candidatus Omnitrophota bacterium]